MPSFSLPVLRTVPSAERATSEFAKRVACGDVSIANELEKDLDSVCSVTADRWLAALSDVTFTSAIVPMSDQQVTALHEQDSSADCLKELEMSIGETMEAMDGTGFFVKLVTRSPKDASFKTARFKEELHRRLSSLTMTELMDDNICIRHLMDAHIKSLRVTNAADALELLLTSERVEEDLSFMLSPEGASVQRCLVVRQWSDSIPLWGEWRGFVRQVGDSLRLVALSQYFDSICYDELVNDDIRSKSVTAITAFFRNVVRPRLLATSGDAHTQNRDIVCDFGVSPPTSPGGQYVVSVIELNPWGCGVGQCMFSRVRDAHLLSPKAAADSGLDDPPLVRYRLEPERSIRAHLTSAMRDILDDARARARHSPCM